MGASSSGLLDNAKISDIGGLVDTMFQDFSVLYQDQFSAALLDHLHQEVEPKKEGRGLLLAQRPQQPSHTVFYQGCVHLSGCEEQVKKWKDRYVVLGKDHNIEIHDNKEAFSRGGAARLVLQTAGGAVFSTEEESRAHLEQSCAAVLKDVKEDSSSVVSPLDAFGVYLHLPYVAPTGFLFRQAEERDHFLSALKTCIRHSNLDPWCEPTYQSQAFIRALQLYRQEKERWESWEMLLGTEEKVLSCQLMEEVLPWLQRELQSKVKGRKAERIRQWMATTQAAYTLVLEQVTSSLSALRGECCQKASSSQTLIRSDLDQIMSSLTFLEEKVRACVCEEADIVCAQCVAPYISSVLEALAEKTSATYREMQQTLRTQMDAVFTLDGGGVQETEKALTALRATSLDSCCSHLEELPEKLQGLKQRFGLSSSQRLVHSAQLDVEKLLENAVYTLELFLQPAAKLQPVCVPVRMAKAKERVLKQLDHDSRVLQRRFYHQALLEITLPIVSRKLSGKWKSELQTLDQYIFSNYSSFILIHNVHDEVLRRILSQVIETVVQDAACKKINNVLVDTSDLAISQYSLLGQTPPLSAPESPSTLCRDSSPAVEEHPQPEEALVQQLQVLDAQHWASGSENPQQDPTSLCPLIVVTEQLDGPPGQDGTTSEEVHLHTDVHLMTADVKQEDRDPPEAPADPEGSEPSPRHIPAEEPELSASELLLEKQSSEQQPSADCLVNIRLGFLSQAIAAPPGLPVQRQGPTDRAVYLSGHTKDNWEVQRLEEQHEEERVGVEGTSLEEATGTGGGEEETGESAEGRKTEESLSKPVDRSVATKEEEEEKEMGEKNDNKKQEEEEENDADGGRGENEEEVQEGGGQGGKNVEEKEEQKEYGGECHEGDGGQGGKNAEEKGEEENNDECRVKEQTEEKKESKAEQEARGPGGELPEEKGEDEQNGGREGEEEQKADRPLVEPQPDSIAAIRELVREVIEVQVEISPNHLQGPPASCNNISPSPES